MNPDRGLPRRRFLRLVGIGTAVAAAACQPVAPSDQSPSTLAPSRLPHPGASPTPLPEAPQTPPELNPQKAVEIINQQIQKLPKVASKDMQTEQQRWSTNGFQRELGQRFPEEKLYELALNNTKRTLNTMQASKISELSNAIRNIDALRGSELVRIEIVPQENLLPTRFGQSIVTHAVYNEKTNNTQLVIYIAAEYVVYSATSLSLALALTRESQRVVDMINQRYAYKQQGKNETEIALLLEQYLIKEITEAAAYGQEAKATIAIAQYGLLGRGLYVSQIQRAANFILFGQDVNNKNWREFVRNSLTQPENQAISYNL